MKSLIVSEHIKAGFVHRFRDGQRRSVRWQARLWIGDNLRACTITDLSLGGARIQLDLPLVRGTGVKIEIPDFCSFEGQTAWSKQGGMGIQFTTSPAEVRSSLGAMAGVFSLEEETSDEAE